MSYQWQIYCETESTFVTAWSDTILTECPHNATHTVNSESCSICKVARATQYISAAATVSGTTYLDIGTFLVQGSNYYVNDTLCPKYLKVNCKVNVGNYDLQVIDDNSNVLFTVTGNSNTTYQDVTFDFGTITYPENPTYYTIQGKTSAGTLSIRTVLLYTQVTPE